MLSPKRVKFRKSHKRYASSISKGALDIAFGEFGLKSVKRGWLTARQIEAARIALARTLKKGGKVWIRVFPDLPVSRKPAETRMGKGKGEPTYWVAPVGAGRVLFEIEGVSEEVAREALRIVSHKLPIPSVFIKREKF